MADLLPEIAFALRSSMRWSAPPWKRRLRDASAVLDALPPAARDRAGRLARRYEAVHAWPALCTAREFHENLFTLDALDGLIAPPERDALPRGRGLDVGAKNGALLPALAAFWPHGWDAVELDAHRRYATLATRRGHGEAMARALPTCRFIAGSVTELAGPYALITWLLPFVFPEPLRAWGLPARFFDPPALLRHVAGLRAPGGALVIVNQGADEAAEQARLLRDAGLPFRDAGPLDGGLSPFRLTRHAFVVRG